MSATIETTITCNGSSPKCLGTYGNGTRGNESAAEQRKSFKVSGWKHEGKGDYCPECWAEIKAAGVSRRMYKYRYDNQ